MRALIDTCVILDAIQSREPFAKEAADILLLAANNVFTGCMTAKSSTDIYYIAHRSTHSDEVSRSILNKLYALFELLDTAAMDCRRAIPSPVKDFEDAVMIETAVRTEMDCIVTRNTKDYSLSSIPVYTPGEFLKRVAAEQDETN